MSTKYFILFLTIMAETFGVEVKTWTLHQLSHAVESDYKVWNHQELIQEPDSQTEALVDALNQIMYALFMGKSKDVIGLLKSPTGGTLWTVDELKEAMQNHTVSSDLEPFVSQAFQNLVNMNAEGKNINATEVEVPALDISVWTRAEIEKTLADPETNEQLVQYINDAKDEMDTNQGLITLITPVGVVPNADGDSIIVPRRD